MWKSLAACALFLAACGGGDDAPHFIPDASNAGCGLGTWTLTGTAGSGTCTTPGTTEQLTIITMYMTGGGAMMEVVEDPSIQINGTTADEAGGCRLQVGMTRPATGPGGENGTESDTISVLETDGDASGFGASAVSGGFTCNQATSYAGTFAP